jgi:glutathione S-transferase
MSDPVLFIGNQKYSSWSLRPWLAMKVKGVAFTQKLMRFDDHPGRVDFHTFSDTGTVPALHHGEVRISEALAILEYVADLHPDRGFWPAGIGQRAKARSISAEMAAGFRPLRNECPMNFAREVRAIDVSDGVRRDVARIEQIWSRCLEASGGPFLFGEFCNADAMYAPVVNRLEIYALSDHPAVKAYTAATQALPAWVEWAAAGKAEPWIYPEDEA